MSNTSQDFYGAWLFWLSAVTFYALKVSWVSWTPGVLYCTCRNDKPYSTAYSTYKTAPFLQSTIYNLCRRRKRKDSGGERGGGYNWMEENAITAALCSERGRSSCLKKPAFLGQFEDLKWEPMKLYHSTVLGHWLRRNIKKDRTRCGRTVSLDLADRCTRTG